MRFRGGERGKAGRRWLSQCIRMICGLGGGRGEGLSDGCRGSSSDASEVPWPPSSESSSSSLTMSPMTKGGLVGGLFRGIVQAIKLEND